MQGTRGYGSCHLEITGSRSSNPESVVFSPFPWLPSTLNSWLVFFFFTPGNEHVASVYLPPSAESKRPLFQMWSLPCAMWYVLCSLRGKQAPLQEDKRTPGLGCRTGCLRRSGCPALKLARKPTSNGTAMTRMLLLLAGSCLC